MIQPEQLVGERVGRMVSAHAGSTLAGKREALANLSRPRRLS